MCPRRWLVCVIDPPVHQSLIELSPRGKSQCERLLERIATQIARAGSHCQHISPIRRQGHLDPEFCAIPLEPLRSSRRYEERFLSPLPVHHFAKDNLHHIVGFHL